MTKEPKVDETEKAQVGSSLIGRGPEPQQAKLDKIYPSNKAKQK